MATAEELRSEFTTFMDKEGIKYQVINQEDNIVRIAFAGRESKGGGADTAIFVDFDEEGDDADSVHFVANRFAKCTLENYPQVLVKVNDYNARYRWVKFYVRREGDVAYLYSDSDATLIPGASALECVSTVFRMSDIVEDVILDLGDLVEADDGKEHLRAMLAALQEMLGEE
jgi:hypothetical protein